MLLLITTMVMPTYTYLIFDFITNSVKKRDSLKIKTYIKM